MKLNQKNFIYLIQDYECDFYPRNSHYQLAKDTYDFDYNAFVSTEPLFEFLNTKLNNKLIKNKNSIVYNNPASVSFVKSIIGLNTEEKNLVIYSRPMVNRNMFELLTISLCKAVESGYFNGKYKWNFWGMGIGKVSIKLADHVELVQLPRYDLKTYYEKINQFDLGISLMASPHPSIVPMDLAGVGCKVITNNFETKNQKYFESISENIISVDPNVQSICEAIRNLIQEIESPFYVKRNKLNYPTNWDQAFNKHHRDFLKRIIN
jgi:hypothetical protein